MTSLTTEAKKSDTSRPFDILASNHFMLLINVGAEEGLEGSEVLNWFRMVLGEMESWKNWESEMVERAEAS